MYVKLIMFNCSERGNKNMDDKKTCRYVKKELVSNISTY